MYVGTFAGYIGRDAETKEVKDTTVTNFSVAVKTGWGDRESTLWVSCAIWGQRGEKLAQYLTKGSAVTVSGDVDVRAYSAKDGSAKAEMTCNVQRVTLQGGGQKTEKSASDKAMDQPHHGHDERQGGGKGGEFDDDIPF